MYDLDKEPLLLVVECHTVGVFVVVVDIVVEEELGHAVPILEHVVRVPHGVHQVSGVIVKLQRNKQNNKINIHFCQTTIFGVKIKFYWKSRHAVIAVYLLMQWLDEISHLQQSLLLLLLDFVVFPLKAIKEN